MFDNLYPSDNLSFVAACELSGKAHIHKAIINPHNNRKVFLLTPADTAKQLYHEFTSDTLVFSAQQLAMKVSVVKDWPIDEASSFYLTQIQKQGG